MTPVNPILAELLDQTCNVLRPAERQVNMTTVASFSSSTGIAVHVQAKTDNEVAFGYGYEEMGDYLGFFHSTEDVRTGDMVRTITGPHAGKKFWLRGRPTVTDIEGIQHTMVNLEFTEDSS